MKSNPKNNDWEEGAKENTEMMSMKPASSTFTQSYGIWDIHWSD